MNKIYVIGHKSPDADSVFSAICMAHLKKTLGDENLYVPAVLGKINKETKYVLEKFGFSSPEVLENGSGKNVFLVDHNEFSQSVNGIEEANIVEVLDHHTINFRYSNPILFRSFPYGATCSIIYEDFLRNGVEISKEMASLMLSAILIDTVITKSPTCTKRDKEIIEELSEITKIDNWKEFGMELFKIRSSVKELSSEEIIKSDFKDFDFSGKKVGIGQVETVDISEFESLEEDLLLELEKIKKLGYDTVILFITDIIKEGSKFLVIGDSLEKFEEAFNVKIDNGRVYIDGIMSRKKQVVPNLEKTF